MKRIFVLLLAVLLLTGCTGGRELGAYPVAELQPRQLLEAPEGLLLCGPEKLVLLDREDLSVKRELSLEISELAYVQTVEDGFSVADPGNGTITTVSPALEITGVRPCGAGEMAWLVRRDGAEVYTFSNGGITAWDLADGTSRELLRCRMMTVLGVSSEAVWLITVGETDIMNHWYELSLTDGTLTEVEGVRLNALQKGLRPQSDGTYLMQWGAQVNWYDENGGFLGFCGLREGETIGQDFVRDRERGGWFFLAFGDEGCRVMFWKPAPEEQGEGFDLSPEPLPEGTILPRELYDRAAELSAQFDVDIRIADRAIRNYGSYDSGLLTDPELTAQALDVLERTLAVYPEGFFTQLQYGGRHSVRIELVDGLQGKNGHDVSSGTSAFTLRRDQYCMIVLNARRIRESVIYHEFSHIIDDRMDFEARLRPDALYSEDGWLALQPEGFRYADSYQNIPDEVAEFYDSGYFVQEYACVSATEDRAETMEQAMMLDRATFDANPMLLPKLQYYCDCIRDSFDTQGWPEVLPWEVLLAEMTGS